MNSPNNNSQNWKENKVITWNFCFLSHLVNAGKNIGIHIGISHGKVNYFSTHCWSESTTVAHVSRTHQFSLLLMYSGIGLLFVSLVNDIESLARCRLALEMLFKRKSLSSIISPVGHVCFISREPITWPPSGSCSQAGVSFFFPLIFVKCLFLFDLFDRNDVF